MGNTLPTPDERMEKMIKLYKCAFRTTGFTPKLSLPATPLTLYVRLSVLSTLRRRLPHPPPPPQSR